MSGISLVDVGLQWFKDAVNVVIDWFHQGIAAGYEAITESLFDTPLPETDGSFAFGTPTNEPWTDLYDALVGGEIMLLGLLILVICVQGRHTIRIFNLGSTYAARKTRRSAWTGAFLIVTWYWVGVLTLYLVEAFTIAFLPDASIVTGAMLEFLAVAVVNPVLALMLAAFGGFAMWIIQALFFLRDILLYVYLYAMPIGVAIAYGNLPVVSRIARRLCLKFIPLAVMPLPVALLFKAYELLFSEGTNSPLAPESMFLSYLIAVSLPVLSVLLVWKLFKYGAPLASQFIGTTSRLALTAGAVVTAGKLAGPFAAASAARWGPAAATGQVVASRMGGGAQETATGPASDGTERQQRTGQDNVAPDSTDRGVPEYRRSENDPASY